MLPGDWTRGGCGNNVFAKHDQCGRCQSPRRLASRLAPLEHGQLWCSNHECKIVVHRGVDTCPACVAWGIEERPEPPGPHGRMLHHQGPPAVDAQRDIGDCTGWLQAVLLPDKPAEILQNGFRSRSTYVSLRRGQLPGGVSFCFPGFDTANVAGIWHLDNEDFMRALDSHNQKGVAARDGPDNYLGQTSSGCSYFFGLMPKWVAGLDLWSDGTTGKAGHHITGLPIFASPPENRYQLQLQAVPEGGRVWPNPPRQRGDWHNNREHKPQPPPPQLLAEGTPSPPPQAAGVGRRQGDAPAEQWDVRGKVDDEAKGLVFGPGLISRMPGQPQTKKKLAAMY